MRQLLLLLSLLVAAPSVARAEPVKLAVMYFENSGNPELEMLRLGLAQMLITDLSGTGEYEVVERTRLNELLGELELQKTDTVDQSTAVQAGKVVGAHYMVLGGYFELMGTFRVDARLVDVATGRVVSVGANGTTAGFMDVQKELVGALEGAIAEAEKRRIESGGAPRTKPKGTWSEDSGDAGDSSGAKTGTTRTRGEAGGAGDGVADGAVAAEPVEVGEGVAVGVGESVTEEVAAAPKDPLGAAMAFSEGLDLLDRKDLARAREHFERALELDPGLDDARSELASLSI